MIEGIHVDIDSEELKTHLRTKSTEHELKALDYRRNIRTLKGVLDGDGQEERDMRMSMNDPIEDQEGGERRHLQRRDYFDVLADHLVSNTTYRLSVEDLVTIEMITSRY